MVSTAMQDMKSRSEIALGLGAEGPWRESDQSRQFRQFLEAMLRVPYLCLVPSGLILMPNLISEQQVPVWLYMAASTFVLVPFSAVVWYRVRSDSLNAYLILSSVSALSLTTGFLAASWQMRLLYAAGWLYRDYILLYVIGFVALCGGTAVLVISKSETLRRKFEFLRACSSQGYMTEEQFWYWATVRGANANQLMRRIQFFGGMIVVCTLIVGFLGGGAALGFVYFLMLAFLAAVLFGITIARAWAHWKYLGWQDLRIANNGSGRPRRS
jgi:hypothetical protein